jgi:dTDP-4-amino-4,6-dideoxygalactose transaminase
MFRATPRHNVNLTGEELRLVVHAATGRPEHTDGRNHFEAAACRFFGVSHAVAIESGRTALYLALLGLGLPDKSTIVLPRYCFFSLVKVVEGMGYTPRFAPVCPDTFALDPARLAPHLEGADAVVLIHPFGQLADMAGLQAACSSVGIPLIEDASQATGARWGQHRAGAIADVGVFSMVSGKNLQTFGGGLLVTHRADVMRRVNARLNDAGELDDAAVAGLFRSGLQRWFLTTPLGFRSVMHPATLTLQTLAPDKLDAMFHETRDTFDPNKDIRRLSNTQGMLGCMELEELDRRNAVRRSNALRIIDGLKGVHDLQLPSYDPSVENSFNAVAIRTADATTLARRLRRSGYDTRTDYMEWFGPHQDFNDEVLYLPNHPAMSGPDVDGLIRAVRSALR